MPTGAAEPPVDPLRPDVRIDFDDRTVHTDLWQRVRNSFGIADLDDAFVRNRERFYASRPDYVQRMAERGGRYLFHIVEEVEKRNLPSELALLPFIESAFNPEAMSSTRASGMWQFMPATGRDFELTQNVFRDDRRDVLASTRAALDYLTRLHDMFGDWHLALAAYNWGEGNVQRAIKRNQKAGRPTDYSSLKMPAETRDYVPKLQAVKNIVANPGAFALTLPELQNHPYFLSVPIARDIDVAIAARLAELAAGRIQGAQPADEQAGDPGRRHAAGAAALRQRRHLREGAGAAQGPARQLDRLGGADIDEDGCSGAATRHVGSHVARRQPHSAAHGDQGRLDAGRATQRATPGRCFGARRRQRDDRACP